MDELAGLSNKSDIISMVQSNKSEAEDYLKSSGFIEEWQDWIDLYRGIPEAKPYHWMSNKFINLTLSKVDTAMSYIMGMLFSVDPPFDVKPRELGDEKQAKIIKALLSYQLSEADHYFKFLNFIKNILIYGTGFCKVYWDTKEIQRKFRVERKEPILNLFGLQIGERSLGFETQKKNVKIFDGGNFEVCNIFDVFVDPQSIDIQDSWVIHRTRKSLAHLRAMYKQGIYNEEVLGISESSGTESQEAKEEIEGNMGRQYNPSVTRPKGAKLIEVLEWWGDYDINGDEQLVPTLFTVADNRLIRADENPFWHGKKPFIKGVYEPLPNDFYGMGIPEMMYDIQQSLNETINQRFDNISFALNRPARYRKGSGVNTKNLIFKPGGIYGADEDNAIQWENIPDVTQSAFSHTQELERWGQEVTAVTKLTLGIGGSETGRTATGMALLQKASGERLTLHSRIIENCAFKKLIEFFYQLDYQFMDTEKIVRIIGDQGNKFISVRPEDVQKDYDFIPAGVFSMEDKNQKALRLIQFINITKGYPKLKIEAIMEKLYLLLDIGNDPREILMTDEEMMGKMQTGQMPIQLPQPEGRGGGQFIGGEMPGVPGVPPVGPPVPPGEQSNLPGIG